MKLDSSYKNQLQQFKKILWDKIELVEWEDIKEVDSTSEEIIIHKALQSWIDYITEYTTIILEWGEEINTKWNIVLLKEQIGKEVTFITHLWYKTVHSIYIYSWKVDWFLSEDLLENKKFLSRDIALYNILSKDEDFLLDIEDIDRWKWEYQK